METHWKRWKPAERNNPRGMESYKRLETIDATRNVRKIGNEGDGSYVVDFTDRLEPMKTFEPLDTDVENVVTVDDRQEVLENSLEENN